VVLLASTIVHIRAWLQRRHTSHHAGIPIVIAVIATMGLLLAVLHGIEATIWALAYRWLGAIESPLDAMLYSLDSMTTRGASGLVLSRHWQLMGALEAADGMLLFGISTAFLFAMMQAYWSMLARRP
jgi:hypothetical protein